MAVPSKGSDARLEIPAPSKFFLNLIRGTAVAGCLSAVAPIERVKLLLQVQDASATITADRRYKGIIDALVRVPKERGFAELWRGNFTNVVRYLPTQALNFAFKDTYKMVWLEGIDRKKDFWKFFGGNLAAGGAAGASALCLVYPLDFARTRLVADVGKGESRQFRGLSDCLVKTVKSEGPTGLYRGFAVSLQGVIIYRAAYFGLFDTAKMVTGLEKKRNFLATLGLAHLTTVVSGTLAYPWDTVRRRMMLQSGGKEVLHTNALDCALKTIRNDGWHALYKGALANVFSRATGGAFALAIYDHVQKFI